MVERSARAGAERAAGAAPSEAATPPTPASAAPVVIKKYANRRLYNTEASSYVTLDDLAKMIRDGRDFIVYDAKSSEDITRGVLTQIIVEEESKGRSMLPESFLRQLIGFYGDSLQAVVPRYLEFAMAGFARQQEQMRRSMEQAMGGFMPAFPGMEEVSKQNLAMMERAMSLFTPFRAPAEQGRDAQQPSAPRDPVAPVDALNREIDRLKEQLAALNPPPPRD